MPKHPEQIRAFTIRSRERIICRLEILADHAGTDLAGYLNATVFFNAVYRDPHNLAIIEEKEKLKNQQNNA